MQKVKFLLDENVRAELAKFLKSKNSEIKLAPKGASDSTLASISKKENRVLVTNDEDFANYDKEMLFSLVWLRIPQDDGRLLVESFDKLLKESSKFEGRLIVLEPNGWQDFALAEDLEI